MDLRPPVPVRMAMAEGCELAAAHGVRAPSSVMQLARRSMAGGAWTIEQLRRLVRWHLDHPDDRGVLYLLHGGTEGLQWARECLQAHADHCATGGHRAGALSTFRGVLDLVAELGGARPGQVAAPVSAGAVGTVVASGVRAWVNDHPVLVEVVRVAVENRARRNV